MAQDACPAGAPERATREDYTSCPHARRAAAAAGDDARNNMPAVPAQQPAPGQRAPLPTAREDSTIPTADGDGDVWVYPSEQMFYNAMRRKNWDPEERDMRSVVRIHNAVNERCWQEILQWEAAYRDKCAQPKLVRFQGRPKDYTPKARMYQLLGYKLPFDRHDWEVDRCGERLTYVIDFYSGQPRHPGDVAFFLDVRPALTWRGLCDRVAFWWSGGGAMAPAAAAEAEASAKAKAKAQAKAKAKAKPRAE